MRQHHKGIETMAFRGIKKGMARTGKTDPWSFGSKGWGKKIWHRIHRQGGKAIVRDDLKAYNNREDGDN